MSSELPPRATFYLVIREGTEAEQLVIWDTVDITVGRQDSCDIVVDDSEVSRNHTKFVRRGEECAVEDLETGLGTLVNGERKGRHDLEHGDVVTIGALEIRFARTTKKLKRASNMSFASELKEFGLVASDDAAGRTMLQFDTNEDLPVSTVKPTPSLAVRAVTADGDVDLADPNSTGIEIGQPDVEFGDSVPVRELDLELGDLPSAPEVTERGDGPPTAPTLARADRAPKAQSADMSPGQTPTSSPAATKVKLVLEVTGPPDKVEEFLAALRDKRISVPPLSLLLRDL